MLGEDDRLEGVLTRRDFLRALEMECAADTPIREIMNADAITVVADDPSLLAADTMREHGIDWLPVLTDAESRRLEGLVHAQSMIARVLLDG